MSSVRDVSAVERVMDVERRPDFDRWFLELYPQAARVAQRVLRDQVAAEDVTAEGFSRALARWNDVGELGYRDAWLLRVVTNLAVDQLRRRPRGLPRGVSADAACAVDDRIVVLEALRQLPRKQRETVVLRYFGEFTIAEVASAMGISSATVKTHLSRGLTGLRADPALLGERGEA